MYSKYENNSWLATKRREQIHVFDHGNKQTKKDEEKRNTVDGYNRVITTSTKDFDLIFKVKVKIPGGGV